ncbi:MAG: gliding motility lipoprotein GldH [Paramuribaculum sp.]|nr:gliding motility lipoprotein GldH [Paramuribaculum sp.]
MVSLRNIIPAVVIASAATIIAGCTAHPSAFSHYARIDESGWRYDDTLRFTPDIPPAVSGELRLGLRHNGNYPYRNLWVEVTTPVAGDSSAVRRDTVSVELADKYGRWNGTGIGALRQIDTVISPAIMIDSGRTIYVRHIMRCDTLPDIEQVGIFIEPSTPLL